MSIQARIYKTLKTPTQSGKKAAEKWILEYLPGKVFVEPVMGWVSGTNTYASQVKLKFSSKEQAVDYARALEIEYDLIESQPERSCTPKRYVQNFF